VVFSFHQQRKKQYRLFLFVNKADTKKPIRRKDSDLTIRRAKIAPVVRPMILYSRQISYVRSAQMWS